MKRKLILPIIALCLCLNIVPKTFAHGTPLDNNTSITTNIDEKIDIDKILNENSNHGLINVFLEFLSTISLDSINYLKSILSTMNETQIKLFNEYPIETGLAFVLAETAKNKTTEMFFISGVGDRSDAFKHGYWNALMVKYLPYNLAMKFGNAQEDHGNSGQAGDGFTFEEHTKMDLNNNMVGRVTGILNNELSDSALAELIYNDINFNSETLFDWLHN